MDSISNDQQIVQKLHELKAQGLNYYQATQALKGLGFHDEQIQQAADSFDYNQTRVVDKEMYLKGTIDPNPSNDPTVANDENNVAKALLKDEQTDLKLQKSVGHQKNWFVIGERLGWTPQYIYSWWTVLIFFGICLGCILYILKFKLSH